MSVFETATYFSDTSDSSIVDFVVLFLSHTGRPKSHHQSLFIFSKCQVPSSVCERSKQMYFLSHFASDRDYFVPFGLQFLHLQIFDHNQSQCLCIFNFVLSSEWLSSVISHVSHFSIFGSVLIVVRSFIIPNILSFILKSCNLPKYVCSMTVLSINYL
jgi:hypothetical protein